MRVTRYLERLDQLAWLNRLLQLLTLALAVAVLLLARRSTIVHIVPPEVTQEYRVGPRTASREYLSQMASSLTTLALTVSPDNAEYAARNFLRHLSPEARGHLEPVLLADAGYVRRSSLTQAFYPKTVDFFSPTRVRVTGTLVQWLGGKVIKQRDVAYNLSMEVRNYAVTITDFSPTAAEEPGSGPAPAPAGSAQR
jgi:type IV conjugative transfer system protein TraE